MSALITAMQQARASGYKCTEAVPLHIQRLKRSITQFAEPEHFGKFYAGKGESKATPKHANPQGSRFKETFTTHRLVQTLEATKENGQFHFYVNRPDKRFFLMMLDIDYHNDDELPSDAWELALLVIQNEFDDDCTRLWTETSRNGKGFYIYFLLANPSKLKVGHMAVEEFTTEMNIYNRYLRDKYNGKEHDFNGETKVFRSVIDGVKGHPYHLDWRRYEAGQSVLENRGILATLPLTGLRSGDAANHVQSGKKTIERFNKFIANYKEMSYPASHFFDRIPPSHFDGLNIRKRHSEHDNPSVPLTYIRNKEDESGGYEIDGTDIERMNQAGWNLSLELRRAATSAEIWERYHALGLNTLADHDGNRQRLCDSAAKWLSLTFDPNKLRKGFDFDSNRLLIKQYVTSEIRQSIKETNRSKYNDNHLAAALYVIEKSSLNRNKNVKMQFTCANDSFLPLFVALKIELGGERESQLKKLAAIKKALVMAGLAEVVECHRQGKGRSYGLGVNHPRRDEFLMLKKSIEGSEFSGK